MNYNIIKDLEKEGEFILGGKAYHFKNPSNESDRNKLRTSMLEEQSDAYTNPLDSFVKSSEYTKNNIKASYIPTLLNTVLKLNPSKKENIKSSLNSIKEKLLPNDEIILLTTPVIVSEELHNKETNSIIYIELSEKIKIGWVVDSTILSMYMGGI